MKFNNLVKRILLEQNDLNIPKLVIDSMMEGKPDHIDKTVYYNRTLERLKGINWSPTPQIINIELANLAVLHDVYHPWFNTDQEIQQFVECFKKFVLNGTPLPENFKVFEQDVNKKYDVLVDDMIAKRPLIVLQKENKYSIIDGSHRFWGKVAQELKKDANLKDVQINAYVGKITF